MEGSLSVKCQETFIKISNTTLFARLCCLVTANYTLSSALLREFIVITVLQSNNVRGFLSEMNLLAGQGQDLSSLYFNSKQVMTWRWKWSKSHWIHSSVLTAKRCWKQRSATSINNKQSKNRQSGIYDIWSKRSRRSRCLKR